MLQLSGQIGRVLLLIGLLSGAVVLLVGCRQDREGPRQEKTKKLEGEIFVVVEQDPDCGGVEALQEKVKPPTNTWPWTTTEGRVFVQFVVTKEGEVVNPTVTRGVSEPLNKAALQAVRKLECKPGRQKGKPVHVQMSLPVTFGEK